MRSNYIEIKFQVSGRSFEAKLFPRATAHGERLWSNPSNDYEQAFERLSEHTDRLIKRGVYSDAVQVNYSLVFYHHNEARVDCDHALLRVSAGISEYQI